MPFRVVPALWTDARYPTVGTCVLLAAIVALIIHRNLRYRQRDVVAWQFPIKWFGLMRLEDAWQIQASLLQTEFPQSLAATVFLSVFKTCGVPSTSRLLAVSARFTDEETVSKFCADITVLMAEVLLNHPASDRCLNAIVRINYLHNHYRQNGRITNEQALYLFSLFPLTLERWCEAYEWRTLQDSEACAIGTYWHWLGTAMNISFTPLLSGDEDGANDGEHFFEQLRGWSRRYEEQHMVPADSNKLIADTIMSVLMTNVPKIWHLRGVDFASAVLEQRTRRTIKLRDPAPSTVKWLNALVAVRRFVVRYILLPRPYFLRSRWNSDSPDVHGRLHMLQYVAHPWYVKPTSTKRWGLNALILRAVGGRVPDDIATAYRPEGYLIEQVGPDALRGKGASQMQVDKERIAAGTRLDVTFRRKERYLLTATND